MREKFGIAFTVELGRVNECMCVCVCVCSVSWQEVFIQNNLPLNHEVKTLTYT